MRRTAILGIGTILVLAACSSSSGGGATQAPPSPGAGNESSVPIPQSGASAAIELPSVDPSDPLAGFRDEDASAVVVIGDKSYEFSGLYCVTMGGALGAQSVGGDPTVNIDLPPLDWETSADDWPPPAVAVSIDDPSAKYSADPGVVEFMADLKPGSSQVDSFTTDGYHASGTATFIDILALASDTAPMTGTFEVTCPRP